MDKIYERCRRVWSFATPRRSCHEKVNVVSTRDVVSFYYNKEALISHSICNISRRTMNDLFLWCSSLRSIRVEKLISTQRSSRVNLRKSGAETEGFVWNKRRNIVCSRNLIIYIYIYSVLIEGTLHYSRSFLVLGCLIRYFVTKKAAGIFDLPAGNTYPTYLT